METLKSSQSKVLRSRRMDGLAKLNAKYDDLDNVPEGKVGELVEGNLYIHSRPRVMHARAITRLTGELRPADEDTSKKGWQILFEVEIWINKRQRTLLVPDLAGWRRDRMPEVPDVQTIDLIPDWVCEGLSPHTARHDKGRKLEAYAKAKISYVWYVDPALKSVEILTFERGAYRVSPIVGGDERGVFPPFAHEVDLGKLWR